VYLHIQHAYRHAPWMNVMAAVCWNYTLALSCSDKRWVIFSMLHDIQINPSSSVNLMETHCQQLWLCNHGIVSGLRYRYHKLAAISLAVVVWLYKTLHSLQHFIAIVWQLSIFILCWLEGWLKVKWVEREIGFYLWHETIIIKGSRTNAVSTCRLWKMKISMNRGRLCHW